MVDDLRTVDRSVFVVEDVHFPLSVAPHVEVGGRASDPSALVSSFDHLVPLDGVMFLRHVFLDSCCAGFSYLQVD